MNAPSRRSAYLVKHRIVITFTVRVTLLIHLTLPSRKKRKRE
jgi:hypothetical protein